MGAPLLLVAGEAGGSRGDAGYGGRIFASLESEYDNMEMWTAGDRAKEEALKVAVAARAALETAETEAAQKAAKKAEAATSVARARADRDELVANLAVSDVIKRHAQEALSKAEKALEAATRQDKKATGALGTKRLALERAGANVEHLRGSKRTKP